MVLKRLYANLKRTCANARLQSDVGLVLDWHFHSQRKWVSALTYFLAEEIIKAFQPVIISSQLDYELNKKRLRYIISMEPGWAAPRIKYDPSREPVKAVFYSDPHNDTAKREKYFFDNNFNYVFSYYCHPFFYHFKGFPQERFVHLPWAIPDELVAPDVTFHGSREVCIFGGRKSPAYDVINWCRQQSCVSGYDFSGCENKVLSDRAYFEWLAGFDAVVAAGSSDPKYDLVTPKYFEIAGVGALLVGQYCKDLSLLGFSEENMIIFKKESFCEQVERYRKAPEEYFAKRRAGLALIRERHCLSHRIAKIREVFGFD